MNDAIADRVSRALVSILIEGDDEAPLYIGSGVLVRLAGVEFVLTVGHNVWSKVRGDLNQISVLGGPRGVNFLSTPGDGSAQLARVPTARVGQYPEPDVAVVELSRTAVLRSDREPFEEHEIGFLAPDAPSRMLVLGGFPKSRVVPGTVPEVGHIALDCTPFLLNVQSLPQRRASEEPADGRGMHVYIDEKGWDERRQRACELPSPYGMSGGPLVVPTGRGVLVGMARSRVAFQGGHDEWCEPAIEAVRALIGHGASEVAASATRILKRASQE